MFPCMRKVLQGVWGEELDAEGEGRWSKMYGGGRGRDEGCFVFQVGCFELIFFFFVFRADLYKVRASIGIQRGFRGCKKKNYCKFYIISMVKKIKGNDNKALSFW